MATVEVASRETDPEDRVRLFSKEGKWADLALWSLRSDPEPTMGPIAISVLKCQYTMLALL